MTKKKILIVDDSMAISKQLQQIIENSDVFEVVGQAKNGLEGIKLYNSLKPDMVIMDLIMPEMDGLQAIRNILSMDKNAHIIVVSSVGGVGDKVVKALEFGAKNVITKPFDPEKLIGIVKTTIG